MNYQFYQPGTSKDVCGKEYVDLINMCFRYSKFFYLRFQRDFFAFPQETCDSMEELNPCLYQSHDQFLEPMCGPGLDRMTFYYCNDETRRLLLTKTDHLFGWNFHNSPAPLPEDLTFFREDGSIFFELVSHDMDMVAFPETGEGLDDILSKDNWRSKECGGRIYTWMSRFINPQVKLTGYQKQIEQDNPQQWATCLQQNVDVIKEAKQDTEYRDDSEAQEDMQKQICQLRYLMQLRKQKQTEN